MKTHTQKFDIFVKIVCALVAIMILVVIAQQLLPIYWHKRVSRLNLSEYDHTIIIYLDGEKSEFDRSINFFKRLSGLAHKAEQKKVKVVPVFVSSYSRAKTYLNQAKWDTDFFTIRPGEIYTPQEIPKLVLFDKTIVTKKQWDGELSSADEVDILTAINVRHDEGRGIRSAAQETSTKAIYDDDRPIKKLSLPPALRNSSINSAYKYQDKVYKEITFYDVDESNNIYLGYQEHIVKMNSKGRIITTQRMPDKFTFGFCTDDFGNSYLYLRSKEIMVWDSNLVPRRTISLESKLGNGEIVVGKMDVDASGRFLYFHTYSLGGVYREQCIYRLDLFTETLQESHKFKRSPETIPTYGLGSLSWSLSRNQLYVADLIGYQIDYYEIATNLHKGTYKSPYTPIPIWPEDSRLVGIGTDLGFVLKEGGMENYPAIWKLVATDSGNLLVFTSARDKIHRQVIHILSKNFERIGTDLKYVRPGIDNHLLKNNLFYVADCKGDEGQLPTYLSPLDTPSISLKLIVYDSKIQ